MINRDLDLYIAEHYKKSNNALLLTGARHAFFESTPYILQKSHT